MSAGVAYVGPSGQTAFVLCAGELAFVTLHLEADEADLISNPALPADCGTPIQPNGANLCVNCLRNSCVRPRPSRVAETRADLVPPYS
jgi:nonsense-mediated mRNA decay protein 3